MALDFTIATSPNEAQKLKPDLGLGDLDHRDLFRQGISTPYLLRFKDYYSDAKFCEGEVAGLLNELQSLNQNITAVKKLILVCQKAIDVSGNIYVYCD